MLIFEHCLPPWACVYLNITLIACSLFIYSFFSTLLVSFYLWICSTLTFAKLPLVCSALNVRFFFILITWPSHVTLCHMTVFIPNSWSFDSSMSKCVSSDPLYLALCLMLWKEYFKKYNVLPTFVPMWNTPFHIYLKLFMTHFLASLVFVVISSFIFL